MIKHNQAWLFVKVFEALLARQIAYNLIILPALKCIFQQIQDHFVIINEKNQFTHRGIQSQFQVPAKITNLSIE